MSEVYLGNPPARIIEWCKRKYNPTPTSENPVCFTAQDAGSSVSMICLENDSEGEQQQVPIKQSLQYSIDNKATWQTWDGDILTLANVGDKVYIKASANNTAFGRGDWLDGSDLDEGDYVHIFMFGGTVEGSGNIQYLLDPTGQRTDVPEYAYEALFAGMGGDGALTKAPDLSATTLAKGCYAGMFMQCETLTATPALNVTAADEQCCNMMFFYCTALSSASNVILNDSAISCYSQMFCGCEALTATPSIQTTSAAEYCCYGMFADCTSLTTPPALPATTLNEYCYNSMFIECGELTATPTLPATTLAEGCYCEMFADCVSLTSLPALPATTLAEGCYFGMFAGCTILSAPELPATTLADDCYCSMFDGCASLTAAPALPATILAKECYCGMFANCSALTAAPELPVMLLKESCYDSMFENCIALSTPPALPATDFRDQAYPRYCYYKMFSGCISLTAAPVLPALRLTGGCYGKMFEKCTALSTPPALPATYICDESYYGMFSGCTALTSVPDLIATNSDWLCYAYMLQNCTSLTAAPKIYALSVCEGEEGCFADMFNNDTNITDVSMPNMEESAYDVEAAGNLATSHTINIHFKSEPSTENPVCFTATQAGSTVAMTCLEANSEGDMQNVPIKQSLQYSTDNQATWQAWDGSIITLANIGDKAFIKASVNNGAFCTYDNFDGPSEGDYVHIFQLTGKIEGSGNIQYLLDPTGQRTDVPEYAYESLFVDENSTGALTKAPDLSATTLAKGCYAGMFYGNTNLTKAPDLLANTASNSCYRYMFYGCNIEDPVKIYATSYDDYSCDNVVDSDSVDPAYHFVQMSRNDVKAAIANNSTIFGDSYYFNAVCSDGETYLFTDEEQTQYQLTGTDVYYYGEYDEYAPSTTIVGTVTSTSEQLTDTGVLSVQFNGAEQLGGFNELVKFTIVSDDEITVSTGDASGFNENEIGDVNYYNINDKDIWIHLPIEVAE